MCYWFGSLCWLVVGQKFCFCSALRYEALSRRAPHQDVGSVHVDRTLHRPVAFMRRRIARVNQDIEHRGIINSGVVETPTLRTVEVLQDLHSSLCDPFGTFVNHPGHDGYRESDIRSCPWSQPSQFTCHNLCLFDVLSGWILFFWTVRNLQTRHWFRALNPMLLQDLLHILLLVKGESSLGFLDLIATKRDFLWLRNFFRTGHLERLGQLVHHLSSILTFPCHHQVIHVDCNVTDHRRLRLLSDDILLANLPQVWFWRSPEPSLETLWRPLHWRHSQISIIAPVLRTFCQSVHCLFHHPPFAL